MSGTAAPRDEPTAKLHRRLRRDLVLRLVPVAIALVIIGAISMAVAPYLFTDATLEREIAAQLRETTGLTLAPRTEGRFELLPRPRVVLGAFHAVDPSRSLSVDADGLDGDVRLLPLIVGRVELSSASLIRPHLAIDLDARASHSDTVIGRAMRNGSIVKRFGEAHQLGTVTLIDGTATIRSKAYPNAPRVDAINLTLDWRDLESPATLTGSLRARDTSADIAAWVAKPSALMVGDRSPVAFHVHAAPLDLSANGDVSTDASSGFRGHVAATAPSIAALLNLFGQDTALLAPFANASLNSDVNLTVDPASPLSIDLPNLTFHADGNGYEGTLAFKGGDHPALSGTLAADQLALSPFLDHLPPLFDAQRRWSTTAILGRRPQPVDLDLRISATHLRLPPFSADDAALAIITRMDRTEVALVEASAYGGTAKGRFSVGLDGNGINLRGAGSLNGADSATLTWDVFQRQLAAGPLKLSMNFETSGDSPAALMRGLRGWAKGSAADGELSGVDLGRCLNEMRSGRTDAWLNALHSGRTPFSALAFGLRVFDGVATVETGTMKGSDVDLVLQGSTDLGDRTLDLKAVAVPPADSAGAPRADPTRLTFGIGGRYDKVLVVPDLGRAPAPPARRP